MTKKLAGFTVALAACVPHDQVAPPDEWRVEVDERVDAIVTVDAAQVAHFLEGFFERADVSFVTWEDTGGDTIYPHGRALVTLASDAREPGEGVGIAWDEDEVGVFADRIEDFLLGLEPFDRDLAVARILAHEIGHAYGLPHRDDSPVMNCCDLPYLELPSESGFLPEEMEQIRKAIGR